MFKISVIIPMYQAEKYIHSCFESIEKQTLHDIEVIAIDDGSTDNTLEMLKNYTSRIPNLTVISGEHGGAGHARNQGLEIAQGEYIKFLDVDDQFASSTTLERMYEVAKTNNADVLIGRYNTSLYKIKINQFYHTLGTEKSGLISLEENSSYPFQEMPGIGDKLFKRNHIQNLRFPEMKWEDLAFTPVLMADANNLYFLDEVVYEYKMRFNNTSITGCLFATNIFEFFDVFHILTQNFKERGIYDLFEKQLFGMFSLHGHFDASLVPFWMNMPLENKRQTLQYFIAKLESLYPDFREDTFVKEYYKGQLLFHKVFELADFMARNSQINSGYLDDKINEFVQKTFKKQR